MTISFSTPTEDFPLAGQAGVSEREFSSAGDFSVDPIALQQVIYTVRGKHAKAVDRGNLLYRISFSTSRLFASPDDAFAWALNHDNFVTRQGELVMSVGVEVKRMVDAVVKPPSRRVIGRTVLLRYVVEGGEITINTPPDP